MDLHPASRGALMLPGFSVRPPGTRYEAFNPFFLYMMRSLLVCALAALPLCVTAGRPLTTDDAGTAAAGSCQVEAWGEKLGSDRAWILAPACGIVAGLEVGADYTRLRPGGPVRAEAGLALKWAPSQWQLDTGAGDLSFGLKAAGGWVRPESGSWKRAGDSLLGLASWELHPAWTVHVNLGVARDTASGASAALLNLALEWTPAERWLLVAETQRNNRREVFGAAVNGVAARWWLVKDVLGLDLSASREAQSGSPTRWTLGLGWYGIGL
jgi:hypothetical protein